MSLLSSDGNPLQGVFMGSRGGESYLRPEAGGCEWTTQPAQVAPLDTPRFISVQHPSQPRSIETIGALT
ncbi:hypothetical protein ABZW10_28415 [Kitasatospora sp. NPDC004723]|uniref:hypothetical protein n=1 Tax=Kitasatospora sp. NPDC004723 TaxID=3154288 RepID=UPI0033B9CDDB